MNTPSNDPQPPRHRQDGIHEEQRLCGEAIDSGEFDDISDAAWVRMCEEASKKAREAG